MSNSITAITVDTRSSTCKRKNIKKQKHELEEPECLIPGLPDHIAQICLSLVPPSALYSVCHSWRRLIYSESFPPFLSIYALLLPINKIAPDLANSIEFRSFDPISSRWVSIPPPPPPPLRLLLRHPSFISRNLPLQSVSVSDKLVLLAATADQFLPALSRPRVFNPLSQAWTYGPPLGTPRRWCAAGSSRGVVYVASGIGSHYNPDVARSVEKWDLNNSPKRSPKSLEFNWKWEKIGGLRDGKFSREAIEAVGWRGKLCMVNVKGDAAKEGIIYNVETDAWEDMPDGMLAGWRGPAAAMDEDTIYVVDESKSSLRKYDSRRDTWEPVVESPMLEGAQHIAAGGGRVCVLCGGGTGIVVVDVMTKPPRFWTVDTPAGYEAVAIHLLPRMSRSHDFQPASVVTPTDLE